MLRQLTELYQVYCIVIDQLIPAFILKNLVSTVSLRIQSHWGKYRPEKLRIWTLHVVYKTHFTWKARAIFKYSLNWTRVSNGSWEKAILEKEEKKNSRNDLGWINFHRNYIFYFVLLPQTRWHSSEKPVK